MRIGLDERFREAPHEHVSGHDLAFYRSGVPEGVFATRDEFLEQVGDVNALACGAGAPWPFDEHVVRALPNLRFIHKIGSGTNWFDVEALTRHGILLANNAGLNATSVADHLLMLTLLCLRSAVTPIVALRSGRWEFVPPAEILEVSEITAGIIGYGNIGSQVARRLLACGCPNILVHRRARPEPASLPDGVRWTQLVEVLAEADVVIVCVPLTRDTEGLLGARELARMKRGSILINGSRGRVVDESALYEALSSGHLRAAACDVFAEEPVKPENPLLNQPGFVGTPHMAGRSRRNSPRQLEAALKNINRFLSGQRPERLVNPEALNTGRTVVYRPFERK
jgi:phosphoglycerate dehydrogenase-like enzyme